MNDQDDLVGQYLDSARRKAPQTREFTRIALRKYSEWAGDTDLRDISADRVQDFLDHQRERGLMASSINQYLKEMRKFAMWLRMTLPPGASSDDLRTTLLRQQQYDRIRAIEQYEVETRTRRSLSSQHLYEALCNARALGTDEYRMVILLAYFGLRRKEVLTLRRSSIDTAAHTVQIMRVTTKNKHSVRTIPYSPMMERFILSGDRATTYLFSAEKNTPRDTQYARSVLKRVQSKATGHLHPHIFRRTFNTMMEEAGISHYIIKRLMGHSTQEDMTDYYIGQTDRIDADMRDAMGERHFLIPLLLEVEETAEAKEDQAGRKKGRK